MSTADWYFCHVNRMQSDEMSAFLSTLLALREMDSDDNLCSAALDEIVEHAEPSLQIYALPIIMDIPFLCHDEMLKSKAIQTLAAIVARFDTELSDCSPVIEQLENLEKEDPALIIEKCADLYQSKAMHGAPSNASGHGYLDLLSHVRETLLLSLLLSAAKQGAGREVLSRRLVEDQDISLFEDAYDGLLGRYSQRLAIELALMAGISPDGILDKIILKEKEWYEYPDWSEMVVRIHFLYGNDGLSFKVRSLFEEARNPAFLRKYICFESLLKTNEWRDTWLGKLSAFNYPVVLLRMWQSVLWMVAADISHVECAQLIEEFWSIPDVTETPPPKIIANMLANEQAILDDAITSPWMVRAHYRHDRTRSNDRYYSEFPSIQHDRGKAELLKLALTVPVLYTLLKSMPKSQLPSEHLVCFFLNMSDALSSAPISDAVRMKRQNLVDMWSQPVCSALCFAFDLVFQIGKGDINRAIPQAVTEAIFRNTPELLSYENFNDRPRFAEEGNTQKELLFSQSAPLVACHWANEALSGENTTLTYGTPWFERAGDSCAAKLIRLVLNDLWSNLENRYRIGTGRKQKQFPTAVITTPVLLAYQVFPEILSDAGIDVDWVNEKKQYSQENGIIKYPNVRAPDLIVHKAYMDSDRWDVIDHEWFSNERSVRDEKKIRRYVLTHKLSSFLDKTPNSGLYDDANGAREEWHRLISEINDPFYLARDLRYLLIEMIRKYNVDFDSKNSLNKQMWDMHWLVVSAVTEFSVEAIFYQEKLAYEMLGLSRKNESDYDHALAKLRIDFIKLLIVQLGHYEVDGHMQSPSNRLRKKELISRRRNLLLQFILNEPDMRRNLWENSPRLLVLEKMRDLETQRTSAYRRQDIQIVRNVQDIVATRNDSERQSAVVHERHAVGTETQVLNLFAEPADEMLKDAWYTGVVISSAKDNNGYAYCEINYGASRSARHYFKQNETLEVGTRLVIQIYESKGNVRVNAFKPMNAWTPEPQDRIIVDVRISRSIIELTHEGYPFQRYILSENSDQSMETLFRYWDSQTANWMDAKVPIIQIQGVVAEYDAEMNTWLPLTADMLMLAIQEFLDPSRAVEGTKPFPDVRLSYIETGSDGSIVMQSSPGRNYKLPLEAWVPESYDQMIAEISSTSQPHGLSFDFTLRMDDGSAPMLELLRIDDTTVAYGGLFEENTSFGATVDEKNIWHAVVDDDRFNCIKVNPRRREDNTPAHWATDTPVEATVVASGWNLYAQRQARVFASKADFFTLATNLIDVNTLKRLLALKAGDHSFPVSIGGGAYVSNKNLQSGYLQAKLYNIPVLVASESLTFAPNPTRPLLLGRSYIVENVHSITLSGNADTPFESEQLKTLQSPFFALTGTAPMGRTKPSAIKLVYENEDKVEVLDVPVTSFTTMPRAVGMLVKASRMQGGWIFEIIARDIRFRALWKHMEHSMLELPQEYIPLGTMRDFAGMGPRMVVQDQNAPVLHTYPPTMRAEGHLCGLSETMAQNGIAHEGDKRRSRIPGDRVSRIVVLKSGSFTLYGDAPEGDFQRASPCKVAPQIFRIEDIGLFYTRRRFIPRLITSTVKPRVSINRDVQIVSGIKQRYSDWKYDETHLFDGALHAEGIVTFIGDKRYLNIQPYYVPKRMHENENDLPDTLDGWTQYVELTTDSIPRVSDVGFGRERTKAFAQLTIRDVSFVASTVKAHSFSLEEFQERYGILPNKLIHAAKSLTEEGLGNSLYYAGEESGVIILKWGMGLCLSVPLSRVLYDGDSIIAHDFFFGDSFSHFTLHKIEGVLHLSLASMYLTRGVEFHVREDSKAGILQQIQIRYDKLNDKINIIGISVRSQRGGQREAWDNHTFSRVEFDPNTERFIRDRIPNGGVAVLMARLDLNTQSSQPVLRFTRVSMADKTLRAGDVLPLVAGAIVRKTPDKYTGVSNDCMIHFTPSEQLLGESKTFRITVMRREFSWNESTLRVYLENPLAFANQKWLVRLRIDNRTQALNSGSVRMGPMRTSGALKDFLRNVNNPIVTIGEFNSQTNEWIVEIRPGVLCYVKRPDDNLVLFRGSQAILSLQDGIPVPRQVRRDDWEYVPQNGRIVELLMLDSALRLEEPAIVQSSKNNTHAQTSTSDNGSSLTIDEAVLGLPENKDQSSNSIHATSTQRTSSTFAVSGPPIKRSTGNHFTVAGLANILLRQPQMAAQLLKHRPPRYGLLKGSRGKPELRMVSPKSGIFVLNNNRFASIANKYYIFVPSPPSRHEIIWSKISFRDASIRDIIRHVERAKWHCHDTSTIFYEYNKIAGRDVKRLYYYPQGQAYSSSEKEPGAVVFFDENDSLRYRHNELYHYAFPAHEINEYGLPDNTDTYYPVAGSTLTTVFVELYPGKLVELSREMLQKPDVSQEKLNILGTKIFSAGDEVSLTSTSSSPGTPANIHLHGIRYGMRGIIGDASAMLPLTHIDEGNGGITLGGGNFLLPYPFLAKGDGVVLPELGQALRLTPQNELRLISATERVKPTDIVMLSYSTEKGFYLCGMPHVQCKLSPQSCFKDNVQMFRYLQDDAPGFFEALGGYLPVRVDAVSEDGMEASISYANPTLQAGGTLYYCTCLGAYGSKLILRTGAYLLFLEVNQVVLGLHESTPEAAQAVFNSHSGIWMRRFFRDGRALWQPGLRTQITTDICQVRLLGAMNSNDGLFCQNTRTLELHFLPNADAGYVNGAQPGEVFNALASTQKATTTDKVHELEPFFSKMQEDQSVSLISTDIAIAQHKKLVQTSGDAQQLRIKPLLRIIRESDPKHYYLYLCEQFPAGNAHTLYYLQSEIPINIPQNGEAEPLFAKLLRMYSDKVVLVPDAQKRTRLHLSQWLLQALRESWQDDGGIQRDDIVTPPCFAAYRKALNTLGDLVTDPHVKLVYYANELAGERGLAVLKEPDCIEALKMWLQEDGLLIASGYQEYLLEKKCEIDLLPALAALQLLNAWSQMHKHVAMKLVSHLLWMLGILAGSSAHQEYLLTRWLMHNDYYRRSGFWHRLNNLSLGGALGSYSGDDGGSEYYCGEASSQFDGLLNEKQEKNLTRACTSILHQAGRNTDEVGTALCLLYACGQDVPYGQFFSLLKDTTCSRLAQLGSTFVPGYAVEKAMNTPQWSQYLRDAQLRLRELFAHLTAENSPHITLIATNSVRLPNALVREIAALCEGIMHKTPPVENT